MPEIIGVPSTSMRPNRSVKISNSYLRARPPAVFLKLTAVQGLVIGSQAKGKSDTHTHTPERGLIFRALSVARRGCTAILPQQKLLTVDAFRVQVRFGNLYFSCIFRCFLSRFNII